MSQSAEAQLREADAIYKKANGANKWWGGRTEKYEQAADAYVAAANAFRKEDKGKQAGEAYEKAAKIQDKDLNEPMDQANTLLEASNVYHKSSPIDAVRVLAIVIEHHSKSNLRRAATYQEQMAEIYEKGLNEPKKAMEAYDTAAKWFDSDRSPALANKCYLKVADLAAFQGDYQRAIEKYEAVAEAYRDHNLMKYSLKDYFQKAGICHLATGDMVATKRALDQYKAMDSSFASQRESILLDQLFQDCEDSDLEAFQRHRAEYNRKGRLDDLKSVILDEIEKSMQREEDDFL